MKTRKSRLLATSALAGAGMALPGVAAAEMMKPAISVGGYLWHDTHFASQDMDEDRSSVLHHVDSEVHFKLAGELDNGLKIGGRIELEGLTQSSHKPTEVTLPSGEKVKAGKAGGDDIDEAFLTVAGGWGMVRFGMANSGRYNHSWSVSGPNVAHGVTSGVTTEWLVFPGGTGSYAFRRPLGSAHPDVSNDDPALTYFTPRFNGFEIALTHRPEIQNTGGRNILTSGSDDSGNYTNALDGSIQYSGDVGGMKVALVLGGGSADGGEAEDYQVVNGGAKVTASGFSFGGHMADVEDAKNNGTGTAYSVGASYGQGPWAVSATFHDGEIDHTAANPASSEMSVWALGTSYTLGPGVSLLASYQNAEVTAETGENNEGSAFTAGLAVRF